MRTFSRILRIVGWAVVIVGVTVAMTTWIRLTSERRRLSPQTFAIDLTRASDWQSIRFEPRREGSWILYLTTVNAFSKPAGEPPVAYQGEIEIELVDPRDAVRLHKRFGGASSGHVRPANMQWSEVARVDLESGRWMLRARVVRPDPAFDRTNSELRFYPPQIRDIGSYTVGETLKIALATFAAVLGLGLVGMAALTRRRTRQ